MLFTTNNCFLRLKKCSKINKKRQNYSLFAESKSGNFFKTITLLISFSSGVSQQAKLDLRHGVESAKEANGNLVKKGLHSTGGVKGKVPEYTEVKSKAEHGKLWSLWKLKRRRARQRPSFALRHSEKKVMDKILASLALVALIAGNPCDAAR